MLFRICCFAIFLIYLVVIQKIVKCENYESLKQKSFFRPTRGSNSKSNNEEFEKFFLKASKSVPRIGRRGSGHDNYLTEGRKLPYFGNQPKRGIKLAAPVWNDIAQLYEYNPDLPNIIEYLSANDQEMGDDPSVYDFDKLKYKRKGMPSYGASNKENMEYRMQAEP